MVALSEITAFVGLAAKTMVHFGRWPFFQSIRTQSEIIMPKNNSETYFHCGNFSSS